MTRICWWWVDIASRMLEPGERDAVRGDVAESGQTGGQALSDVLGLVARRQAALWKDWRPWLALIGVVGLAGVLLIRFSDFVSRTYDLYFWIIWGYKVMDKGILDQTGLMLRHGIVAIVCYSFLLVSWSWTGGFVLGSLSRRTIWVNGALFCLVWLFFPGAPPRISVTAAKLSTVLFLLPFIWGVRQGLRLGAPRLRQAIYLAAAIASVTALAGWTDGWWRGGIWQRMQLSTSLALCWPAAYMLATASWRQPPKENNT